MLLQLQSGILYGPVESRRYGRSLGINLMPKRNKLCSFDCVYCHYGRTKRCTSQIDPYIGELPSRLDVIRELERRLAQPEQLDLITFSGNGEPTLHPDFPELVVDVLRLRDKYKPEARVALLSNSTGLTRSRVRQVVAIIDLPVFKLDAGTPATFKAVNRPASDINFDGIVDHLASLKDICIQTTLIAGYPSNIQHEELSAYFGLLRQIHPREVHMYSIDRPVPDKRIVLVNPDRLMAIADEGRREAGVCIKVVHR